MVRAAIILFTAVMPALAADPWIRLTTPDFELYTTGDEKNSRATIRLFDQVREFFLKASPVRGPADFPVRIVEFTTEDQYRLYRPNDFTSSYFFATPARDYIVIGDRASTSRSPAINEYMH